SEITSHHFAEEKPQARSRVVLLPCYTNLFCYEPTKRCTADEWTSAGCGRHNGVDGRDSDAAFAPRGAAGVGCGLCQAGVYESGGQREGPGRSGYGSGCGARRQAETGLDDCGG